jgi:hypothetical protein
MKVGDWVYRCVGPGWHDILGRLVRDLLTMGWSGEVSQVKEKFGGLRFYCESDGEPGIYKRIDQAEDESFRTCEECGKDGKPREGSWIKTLCDKCAEER